MGTIPARQPQRQGTLFRAAALSAALGLVAATGAVTWQVTQRQSGTAGEVATSAAPAPVPPAVVRSITSNHDQFTVYIVDSEEAGDLLRWNLERFHSVYDLTGWRPQQYEIIVAATRADELRIQQALTELDAIRSSLNLPAVRRIQTVQRAEQPVSDQEMYQAWQVRQQQVAAP